MRSTLWGWVLVFLWGLAMLAFTLIRADGVAECGLVDCRSVVVPLARDKEK